jgi:predicted nuclease with TOPRIM domain
MNSEPEKFVQIDQRLDFLGEAITELRSQQQANTAGISTLQGLTSELLDIARLHQQGLRILQGETREMQAQMREMQAEVREIQAEVREIQAEVRQIWQYLLEQRGNGQHE